MIPVVVYPAQVQGEGAGAQVARAIAKANARAECDVLIVCRGGGSLEDLWAFNEEAVARAIVGSAIPVVSGVGHETDFSIADFVADLRAATPTAAAAAATPDTAALRTEVDAHARRLARSLRRTLESAAQRLDHAGRRLLTPAERLERLRSRIAQCARGLARAAASAHELRALALSRLARSLAHLDPTQVLGRGYSIVRGADGHVRRSSAGLKADAPLDITFAEGGAAVTVTKPR